MQHISTNSEPKHLVPEIEPADCREQIGRRHFGKWGPFPTFIMLKRSTFKSLPLSRTCCITMNMLLKRRLTAWNLVNREVE